MTTFKDLGLRDELLKAIEIRKFAKPTAIQEQVIPFLLSERRDMTGLAQTGTGKTAAFALPILQSIDTDSPHVQALILCPTRELCQQVAAEIADYGKFLKGLRAVSIYGGAPFGPQIKNLRSKVHIITATPGRLKDLMERDLVPLKSLRYAVLDEADRMLDMGFRDDLIRILEDANSGRQTLLFSATMPKELARIALNYMNDPREIVSGEKNRGTSSVRHSYFQVDRRDKYRAVSRLIDFEPDIYGIIFCRTREMVKSLCSSLMQDSYVVNALHGELSQSQREMVMQRFRTNKSGLLVATDVAARGLDVVDLSHVIHFDLPDDAETYNHRSGRTGRAGKSGQSLSLVDKGQMHRIRRFESVLGQKIEKAQMPSVQQICRSRVDNFLDRLLKVVPRSDVAACIQSDRFTSLDVNVLIERLVSLELGNVFDKYKDGRDLRTSSVSSARARAKEREKTQISGRKKRRAGKFDLTDKTKKMSGKGRKKSNSKNKKPGSVKAGKRKYGS